MTQTSEERIPEFPTPARVLPFERQSELQRAIQERAQERIDAESAKPRVSVARRIVTFAVALIPVGIIFSGFLLAVHAVRIITSLYSRENTTTSAPAPETDSSEPGVVILVPDKSITPAPDEAPPQQ
ncbi:MAG TPA: hypothetical protein VFR96_04235 [Povalibacter sp.]|jgi:hypothetical protein|nr:hypothetical protein [Povalibacter sp.]